MSKKTEPNEETPSEHLRKASDSGLDTASNLGRTIVHLSRWIRSWLERHWVIKWIGGGLALSGITWVVIQFLGRIYDYYFGMTGVIGRDLIVQTHPLPVGFSLQVLFILFVILGAVGYFRIASLRRRVEALEDKQEFKAREEG